MTKLCLTVVVVGLVLTACQPTPAAPTSTAAAVLPNPASVYCEAHGHRLEIRTAVYYSPAAIPVFTLNVFTHGLVLGWLIFKTDSLWASVTYHLAMDYWLFIGPLGSGG